MSLKSVRQQCERALQGVPVPNPFDINAFCDVVSRRRQRALHLVAKDTTIGPCGLWLSLPDSDYVIYEPDTSRLHREHIILHELGHLLCEHQPTEVIDDEVLTQLFPSLDRTVVRRVLGRSTYTAVEEQEAEMMASLIRERAEHAGGAGRAPAGGKDGAVLDRLEAVLGVGTSNSHG